MCSLRPPSYVDSPLLSITVTHTCLQYCTILIHCSLACFSSRILLDSELILCWRCIAFLGLAVGDACWISPSCTARSFLAPQALHTAVLIGLTRVHAVHDQPESTAPGPSKGIYTHEFNICYHHLQKWKKKLSNKSKTMFWNKTITD